MLATKATFAKMNAPEHIDIPAIDASAAPLASGKNAAADCKAAAIPAGGGGTALPNAVAKEAREGETRVAIRKYTDDVTIGDLNESKRLKTQVDLHTEHGILGQMLWTIHQMQASVALIPQMKASLDAMVLPVTRRSNNDKVSLLAAPFLLLFSFPYTTYTQSFFFFAFSQRTWNSAHRDQLRPLQVEHAPNAPNHAQIGSEPGDQPASIGDIIEMDENQLEAWETAFNHTLGGATIPVKRQSLTEFYIYPGFY
jgi:hypothetical protein